MQETLKRKLAKESAFELISKGVEMTAKPVMHASDAFSLGSIPIADPFFAFAALAGKYALKMTAKNIDRAKGIHEVELFHKDYGLMRIKLKVRTMPDGRRIILKKLEETVIKPSKKYIELTKQREEQLKMLKKQEYYIKKINEVRKTSIRLQEKKRSEMLKKTRELYGERYAR